ncbi:MAG: efflux RND transporter periplasmic adaptor subunit [Gemmatimonadaceae bacterium]|nr:efflux RND transporter periplasmic adaptor subunit [Gemmatimonadaceae bacterium]
MASVGRGTLSVTVSGPGRTDALDVQKVRAPFAGTLESLAVVIGDRVESGQTLGTLINQTSQAALSGAQVMLREAKTAAERSDAARALEIAKANLVQTVLRAPRAGIVISRGASQGDLVSPGDSIISIASANSIVFVAHIPQNDLGRIRAGLRATIDAPGRSAAVDGVVHGFLPADTSTMSVPVRIDLQLSGAAAVPIGLFGTAHIAVAQRANAIIVPAAAILRDDVNGTTRVAVVDAGGRARWTTVSVGVQQGNDVEILSPPLVQGTRVIVSGQVGLPDGSHVVEAPADSTSISGERAPSTQP